jgi:hypothetical protein
LCFSPSSTFLSLTSCLVGFLSRTLSWSCFILVSSYNIHFSQAWWYIIPALRKLRQEDGKFKASLSYIVRPWLKK